MRKILKVLGMIISAPLLIMFVLEFLLLPGIGTITIFILTQEFCKKRNIEGIEQMPVLVFALAIQGFLSIQTMNYLLGK